MGVCLEDGKLIKDCENSDTKTILTQLEAIKNKYEQPEPFDDDLLSYLISNDDDALQPDRIIDPNIFLHSPQQEQEESSSSTTNHNTRSNNKRLAKRS